MSDSDSVGGEADGVCDHFSCLSRPRRSMSLVFMGWETSHSLQLFCQRAGRAGDLKRQQMEEKHGEKKDQVESSERRKQERRGVMMKGGPESRWWKKGKKRLRASMLVFPADSASYMPFPFSSSFTCNGCMTGRRIQKCHPAGLWWWRWNRNVSQRSGRTPIFNMTFDLYLSPPVTEQLQEDRLRPAGESMDQEEVKLCSSMLIRRWFSTDVTLFDLLSFELRTSVPGHINDGECLNWANITICWLWDLENQHMASDPRIMRLCREADA